MIGFYVGEMYNMLVQKVTKDIVFTKAKENKFLAKNNFYSDTQ
jgi:hypothetical protein